MANVVIATWLLPHHYIGSLRSYAIVMNVYSGTLQSGIALYSQSLTFGQVKTYPPAIGGHLPAARVGDNGRSTRPRQAGAHQSTSE